MTSADNGLPVLSSNLPSSLNCCSKARSVVLISGLPWSRKQLFMVLRTFQWVKIRWISPLALRISRKIRLLLGVELESAAVKVDGDLHVLAIAEAIGVFLTVWIFEFSPSISGIGDAMVAIGQHVRQVGL